MCRSSLIPLAVLGLAITLTDGAAAQSGSLFGSGGNAGGGANQSSGGSGSLFGSSGGGSQGGGLNNSGGQPGASGNMSGPQLNQLGSISGQVGQGGFTGRNSSQGFVGQRNAGQGGQAGRGQGNQSGNQFAGLQGVGGTAGRGQGGQGRQGGRNGQGAAGDSSNGFSGMSGAGSSSTRVIRPQHRVAFTYTPVPQQTIVSRLQAHLQQLDDSSVGALAGLTVDIDPAGKAVVRGEVDTDETRGLVEALIRIEPGVTAVVNEVTVR